MAVLVVVDHFSQLFFLPPQQQQQQQYDVCHQRRAAGRHSAGQQRAEVRRKRGRLRSGARGLVVLVVLVLVFGVPLFAFFCLSIWYAQRLSFFFYVRKQQHSSTIYATTSDGPRGGIALASDKPKQEGKGSTVERG